MKILVTVKRVVDYNVRIRIKADASDVDTAQLKMAMNPFDEIALEEALRLKEAGIASEIIAVSLGTLASQDVLRTALALGADRAILLESAYALQPLGIAKALKALCQREAPPLILCGKQAIDDDANQTAQMLAALLDYPHASNASKIVLTPPYALVTCETDHGLTTVELTLPALITTDLRLNEPRYATLPNILKAKKKALEIIPIDNGELGLNPARDFAPRLQTLRVEAPPERRAGVTLHDVAELMPILRPHLKGLP